LLLKKDHSKLPYFVELRSIIIFISNKKAEHAGQEPFRRYSR